MYILMIIQKTATVSVLGIEKELELCWADGMIDAVPVFETYEDAKKYAGDKDVEIYKLNAVGDKT